MLHSLGRFLFGSLIALTPLLLPVQAVADVSVQDVGIACADGSSYNVLSLDSASVTDLSDALDAMRQNAGGDPALNCNMTAPSAASPTATQVMAGGGVAAGFRFAFGAHADATGTQVGGHYRLGDLAGPVTCLVTVDKTGSLGGPINGFPADSFAGYENAHDGSASGEADTWEGVSAGPGPVVPANQANCTAVLALFPPTLPLTTGNIFIRGLV